MAFRVELTSRAKRDLIAIAHFIRTSKAATRWFAGLQELILSLDELPERGTSVAAKPKYRQLLYGSFPHVYRILYRVDGRKRCVYIVHVRHGARTGSGL